MRAKPRLFSHFWDAPFRPLFLAAFLCAFFSILIWPIGEKLGLPTPGIHPPVLWHMHELLFGFTAAAIGGYVLTALPNWTDQQPVAGILLKLLVLLWGVARGVNVLPQTLPTGLVVLINLSYFLLLSYIVARQISVSKAFRKLSFVLVVLALGMADVAYLTAANMGYPWVSHDIGHHVFIGLCMLLIVVGAKLIAAFTKNWLNINQIETSDVGLSSKLNLLVLALLMIGFWLFSFVDSGLAYAVLLCTSCLIIWSMCAWQAKALFRSPLIAALHVSFWWIPAGFCLLILSQTAPSSYRAADALHAITIGAMSGLIMAISGRAAALRNNGVLHARKSFYVAIPLVWTAALVRLLVPAFPQHTELVVVLSATIWCSAWFIFIIGFLPALYGPAPRPVLSGAKHAASNSTPAK
ncbi:NnrS family protein [Cognatishimia sp. WU-CL00825]|uniref:NnrS family protein n=1 Tax=Cognatishimia sp. WU-CL00825 TaxID=3127658 RepID=UPI0033656643